MVVKKFVLFLFISISFITYGQDSLSSPKVFTDTVLIDGIFKNVDEYLNLSLIHI